MTATKQRPVGTVAFMPEPGRVELRRYDVPAPPPGGMVLRTLIAGVCGSEIHIFGGHHPVLRSAVLGHEIVGEVAVLADGVIADAAGAPLQVGDAVTVTYFRSCRACPACARQEFALCVHALDGWLQPPDQPPHFVGTMGTHYVVDPRQWVFKLPPGVTPHAAASANCAVAQVVNALEKLALRPREWLVVQGAGGLGLYAVALASQRGARVVAIDGVAHRLERAAAFGADAVIDLTEETTADARRARVLALTGGEGADAAIDVTGSAPAFAEGLTLLRAGARLVEVGMVLSGVEATFDLGGMARRGITVHSAVRYEPRHLQEALAFLQEARGRLPLDDVIDATYGLDEVADAIRDSAARRVTRAAVVPGTSRGGGSA